MEEKKQERRSGFTSKLEKQAVSLLLAKDELEKKNIELENAMIDARKASRARDVFLANMSHEIRTPINTMLGLNELILRESQDETIRGYALDIKQAGTILLSLVSDILDFSKLQSGKMELAEGTYDISSLLNDLINSVSIPLRKKKLPEETSSYEGTCYVDEETLEVRLREETPQAAKGRKAEEKAVRKATERAVRKAAGKKSVEPEDGPGTESPKGPR